jgi:uncharacterized UBP type Zn finger protein
MPEECSHIKDIKDVKPKTKGCEECEKEGKKWIALNLCMTCGHVGCCDSSQKHARKHFEETGHPVVSRITGGPLSWKWCYVDTKYI